jgi:hypothetical protein
MRIYTVCKPKKWNYRIVYDANCENMFYIVRNQYSSTKHSSTKTIGTPFTSEDLSKTKGASENLIISTEKQEVYYICILLALTSISCKQNNINMYFN